MSDTVEVPTEEFGEDDITDAGQKVTIHIGAFNYFFEKTPHGTLIYLNRYPVNVVDDDDPEPFDPSEYR